MPGPPFVDGLAGDRADQGAQAFRLLWTGKRDRGTLENDRLRSELEVGSSLADRRALVTGKADFPVTSCRLDSDYGARMKSATVTR